MYPLGRPHRFDRLGQSPTRGNFIGMVPTHDDFIGKLPHRLTGLASRLSFFQRRVRLDKTPRLEDRKLMTHGLIPFACTQLAARESACRLPRQTETAPVTPSHAAAA